MTDAPQTAADIIEWFTATEIVRHDGSRSPREPHMSKYEAMVLSDKVGKPNYYDSKRDKANPVLWTAESIWSTALAQNLFMSDRFGWIDREGRFWGCGFAAHELLLHFMGEDVKDVEQKGWVRVSMGIAQCLFQPSSAQIQRMDSLGLAVQAARLLDGPKPPRGMKV